MVKRLGEFEFIRAISKGKQKGRGVLCGIGDDAAIVRSSREKDLLMTTDMVIEGVHFRTDTSSLIQIGRKAMLVNLSDIAAMGGVPRYAVVAAGMPVRLPMNRRVLLMEGMEQVARENRFSIVGGDTNRSDKILLSVTLIGEVETGRGLKRDGARSGDLIYVTGKLGEAAEALKKKTHHEPPNRVQVGRWLVFRKMARSCIDISDGFLGDLNHILEESRVGVEIWTGRLPGKASLLFKLTGGEDYELLFTASPHRKIPSKIHGIPVTVVGTITSQMGGISLCDEKGRRLPLPRRLGFSHF
ncbi:MAG: thiamine-phosphate kinase [Deltaproteobacteria bacterium]|nr:thiamine-phosphate kinase [Deltaproteobacteria bacterium]